MRSGSSDSLDRATDPEWMTRPERGSKSVLRVMAWFALTFGRRTARLLLYPVCFYFLVFGSAARTASRNYLRKVLGHEPRLRDSFRHFYTFSSVLLDRVLLLSDQFEHFEVRVHGDEITKEMLEHGTGCVLLGAHMGSFEIVRALARERKLDVSLVMYEENAREFQSFIQHVNPGLSQQVIALGNMDSMLKVEAALGRGEFVGMLADRNIRGEGTISIDFLGCPVRFPTGPFRAAVLLKCPAVLMVGLFSGGNRYDVYFERLADARTVEQNNHVVVEDAMKRYVARIEHYCRFAPYNWFNFYDYWK